jgi:chromosome segregation ATPase
MATSWDTEMVERLKGVERRLDNVDRRLEDVDRRLDTVDTRLDKVDSRLDRLETKVDVLGAELSDVKARMATKAELEQVRDDMKRLAEAQQAGFQQLSRQMVDFGKHWDMKWAVHDLAIRDHGKRIARLERRSSK